MTTPVMTIEESRRTQRPYRYGMILLCFGALANWLGLAENYAEPVRYLGVACIIAGALLICTAMCCWLHTPQRTGSIGSEEGSVNVITVSNEIRCEKPPEYDTVASLSPPSYDDAIKLNPSVFLAASATVASSSASAASSSVILPEDADSSSKEEAASSSVYLVSNSSSNSTAAHLPPSPPVYTITTAMPNEAVTYDNERRRGSRDPPSTTREPSAGAVPRLWAG